MPAPIVAWANSYIDLLGNTILSHYEWQEKADATAVYVVVVSVVVVGITFAKLPQLTLKWMTWCSLGLAAIAFFSCIYLRHLVSSPGDGKQIVYLRDGLWQYSYIALIVLSMLALTFAILSWRSSSIESVEEE